MTDRPDLDEEYMKDAIATAKQMGAVVKDSGLKHPHDLGRMEMTPDKALTQTAMPYQEATPFQHPHDISRMQMTDEQALTQTAMSYQDETPLKHPHDISRMQMTDEQALEGTAMSYKDAAPSHIVKGDDAAIEEHIEQGIKRGTITDATKPAVGDGKFTSRPNIACRQGAGREIG